jgi:hypothetical protein
MTGERSLWNWRGSLTSPSRAGASVRVRVLAVAEELVERDADGSNRLPDGINGPS